VHFGPGLRERLFSELSYPIRLQRLRYRRLSERHTNRPAGKPGPLFVQDLSTGKLPQELQGLSFDTIISTEVIEHLYDPEAFIVFCKQALSSKGEIILSTPYHGYLKNLVLSIFNKWDSHLNPLWLGGHIKMWSAKTLSGALTNNGFTVTGFKGCGRIPYLWKSMLIKAKLN
jgi:SAM-dependent methyltransferase